MGLDPPAFLGEGDLLALTAKVSQVCWLRGWAETPRLDMETF